MPKKEKRRDAINAARRMKNAGAENGGNTERGTRKKRISPPHPEKAVTPPRRGRPPKQVIPLIPLAEDAPLPKRRGRPPKKTSLEQGKTAPPPAGAASRRKEALFNVVVHSHGKGNDAPRRGRPRKNPLPALPMLHVAGESQEKPKRGRREAGLITSEEEVRQFVAKAIPFPSVMQVLAQAVMQPSPFHDALVSCVDRIRYSFDRASRHLNRDINRLHTTVASAEELKALNKKYANFEVRLVKSEADTREYYLLADNAQATAKRCQDEVCQLREKADTFERKYHEITERCQSCRLLPETHEAVPGWVERELVGRLVLHPRALKTLRDGQFDDVPFMCNVLSLLADSYRRVRLGTLPPGDFERRLHEMRLRFSSSASPSAAGKAGDDYYVTYPLNSQVKAFLKYHVRNTSGTRDPARCLAIYFFWDRENKLVVVGSLPGHLAIRSSN